MRKPVFFTVFARMSRRNLNGGLARRLSERVGFWISVEKSSRVRSLSIRERRRPVKRRSRERKFKLEWISDTDDVKRREWEGIRVVKGIKKDLVVRGEEC